MKSEPPAVAGGSTFSIRRCYNGDMPNEKADDKKTEAERGEQAEKSSDQSTEEEGPREKRKRPEPPGNLKKRGDWFKKRH